MKSIEIRTTILLVFLFFQCWHVAASDTDELERKKRHAVSRIYEITESMVQRCSHASPDVANKYMRAVTRFTEANPRLIALVKQSPHYEYAQKNYAFKRLNEWETESGLNGPCIYYGDLINSLIDFPQGVLMVSEFETLLSR